MTEQALNLAKTLAPELILLIGGSLIVMIFTGGRPGTYKSSRGPAMAAVFTVLLAAGALVLSPFRGQGLGADGPIIMSVTAQAARWVALALGLFLIPANAALPETRPGRESDRGSPEFFMLLLFSLCGVMLTASANDLVVLFLALELVSVPTFIVVAMSRPQPAATEAGGKYFFLGALSAALLLMGFAWLFGSAGDTRLPALFARELTPVLLIGMGLAVVGLAFKIAAFPYHTYIADVYQGAAAPVAGWLAFAPKAAGLLALGKLLTAVGGPIGMWIAQPAWLWTVFALAVVTMTVGNVLALWQKNVKRLLAYSSVAHSGYLLVALLVRPEMGNYVSSVLLFYLFAYGMANLGAFLVLSAVRVADPAGGTREAESFDDIRGLARRNLPLAAAMGIFVFALMGLPPTVGFMGKIYIFLQTYRQGHTWSTWLVVIALVNAAIGAGYYLRIIGACFTTEREDTSADPQTAAESESAPRGALVWVIGALALATLAIGLFPGAVARPVSDPDAHHDYRTREPEADETPTPPIKLHAPSETRE